MNDQLLQSDDFTIWQPSCVNIVKSKTDGERRIGGYCSTEHIDRQGEVVLQRGLDFDEFVKFGYFNDNHNQATAAVVGIPDRVEYHNGKGWYTEGTVLKGMKRSEEIWELARSLEGTNRRLGFSIEGKVLERRDNYIVKARIRNVAVTNAPVNTNCTWSVLAKAMTAGHDLVATGGVSGDGRPEIPQDLEHDECSGCSDCKEAHKSHKHGKKCSARKSVLLDEDASVALIQRVRPHYSEELCRKIYNYASRKGA